MAILRIYIGALCEGSTIAHELAQQVRSLRPHQPVEIIDLSHEHARRPAHIFGTPTYCLDKQIIFLGNPNLHELLATLDKSRTTLAH
jgi:hypothetical protein